MQSNLQTNTEYVPRKSTYFYQIVGVRGKSGFKEPSWLSKCTSSLKKVTFGNFFSNFGVLGFTTLGARQKLLHVSEVAISGHSLV